METLKAYFPLILILILAVILFFVGKKNAERLNSVL